MLSFDEQLNLLIKNALQEDIGDGDHSVLSCIPAAAKGKAVLKIKDRGMLAGVAIAQTIFTYKEPSSTFTIFKNDGDDMEAGEIAFEVIASIHSNLKMTEDKAMMRLLKAISNPYVTILGHMTGRLLLSRNGYPVDTEKIIDVCAKNHVAIELNAHPRRLDMDWKFIGYAIEKGVLISIDPDAHAIEGFDDVKYGVLSAQKAGLTKEHNLSSFTLNRFENYLAERKKKKRI